MFILSLSSKACKSSQLNSHFITPRICGLNLISNSYLNLEFTLKTAILPADVLWGSFGSCGVLVKPL